MSCRVVAPALDLRQFGIRPFDRDLHLAEVDGARWAIDRKHSTARGLQRLENDLPIEPRCSAPAI